MLANFDSFSKQNVSQKLILSGHIKDLLIIIQSYFNSSRASMEGHIDKCHPSQKNKPSLNQEKPRFPVF